MAIKSHRPRRHPHINTFSTRFFQNPCTLGDGCTGGHHIVDQGNMVTGFPWAMPGESPLEVLAALFTAQARLRSCAPLPSQCICAQGEVEHLAGVGSQFISLVKTPCKHAQTMQWYRDQHIGQTRLFPDGRFTDQVAKNPACCQLALEFKALYQAINRKLILERAYGTEVWRRFVYADTADGIPGRAQRKSASEAM